MLVSLSYDKLVEWVAHSKFLILNLAKIFLAKDLEIYNGRHKDKKWSCWQLASISN